MWGGSSWICWTSSLYVWQGQIIVIEEMTESVSECLVWKHMCVYVCLFFPVLSFDLSVWSVSFLLLSIPPWIYSDRTADAILGYLLFGMLHLPARTVSLSLSVSLSSHSLSSCWLTQALRRQVCSTTLILCKKHKQPSPLTLSSFSFPSFTLTATLPCLSLDGFV